MMDSGKRFLLFLISSSLAIVSSSFSKGITLKLIHRDSINYSSNNPSPHLSRQAFRDSMFGSALIEETVAGCGATGGGGGCPNDIDARLLSKPGRSVLFVEFFIKYTSYKILAVMDTGSSLTWVHCLPCKMCDHTYSRIYNQRMSSTYRNISCKSPYCNALSNHGCDKLGNCEYMVEYLGASSTNGSLSMESFIFETSDGFVTIPNVVFGCSHLSEEHPDSIMGVVGLNGKITSLVAQLGGKFSYCIDNINDKDYKYNQLSFGNAARFEGDMAPLFVEPYTGFYYTDLEGISFGGKMMNLPTKTFRKRYPWYGGVLIDSGNEDTFLPMEVYDIVAENVWTTALLKHYFSTETSTRRLCLEGNLTTDMDGFPFLTFHFPGGAELAMDVDDLFFQRESAAFCLTLATSMDPPGLNYFILGIHPQLHNNIGIDPTSKKLYIQRMDCQLLQ